MALAVERVDVAQRQQLGAEPASAARAAATRARDAGADVDLLHRRARRASSAVPSTSTPPLFITVTRSASANTRSMSCSTSSTGMSRRDALDQAPTRSRSAAASPASGSSSSRTRGPDARAKPMSSRRWPPYDSVPPSDRARCRSRPRKRMTLAVSSRSRARSSALRQPLKCGDRAPAAARRTFSLMDNRREQVGDLERTGRARCRRVLCGGRALDLAPSSATLPCRAGTVPDTRLNNVVLPAPLGPISAWLPAASTVKPSSHGPDAAELPGNCKDQVDDGPLPRSAGSESLAAADPHKYLRLLMSL